MNVVLLGDSVFDNGRYVAPGEPDVARQLRTILPAGEAATLLAVDGATIAEIRRQIERLPADATHLVVSAGGNDAIGYLDVLEQPATTVADALDQLGDVRADFTARYGELVEAIVRISLPSVLCTIYNPRFPDRQFQRLAVAGLSVLNDVIVQEASRRGLAVIDLRDVCTDDADFANPVEPSARGGAKIASVIAAAVAEHDAARGRTTVFTSR